MATVRTAYESVFGSRRARSLRPWTKYFRDQKIAGYIGWVGYGNFGDELLFDAIRDVLEPIETIIYRHPEVLSYNRLAGISPLELTLYQRFVKQGPLYDLTMLGGGTLVLDPWYLPPVKSAIRGGAPVVVFGTGAREEAYVARKAPSQSSRATIAEWVALLNDMATIKVRGPLSAEILAGHGVRAEVIGDPALLACLPQSRGPRGRRIGISLGGTESLTYGSQEVINDELAKTALRLRDLGWEVEWLVMDPEDLAFIHPLLAQYGLTSQRVYWHPSTSETLAALRRLDILIGQRLHAVIAASGMGIPSIAVAHCLKPEDFMHSIGRQAYCVRAGARAEQILALVEEIDKDHEQHSKAVVEACDKLRTLQRRAAEEIRKLARP